MMLGAVPATASRFWVLLYRLFKCTGTPGHQSLKSLGISSRVTGILKLRFVINQKASFPLRKEEPELKKTALPLKLARGHMKTPGKLQHFGRESVFCLEMFALYLPILYLIIIGIAPHFDDSRSVWKSEF